MAEETRAERAARTAAPHRRRPEAPAEGLDERVAAEVARRVAGPAVKARPSLPTIADDPTLDPEQRMPAATGPVIDRNAPTP
jgi:hypothetical protein